MRFLRNQVRGLSTQSRTSSSRRSSSVDRVQAFQLAFGLGAFVFGVVAACASQDTAGKDNADFRKLTPAVQDELRACAQENPCGVSEQTLDALETALSRDFDVLSIQAEGEEYLAAYIKHVPPVRGVRFLKSRINKEEASVRIFLLRAVASIRDPNAIDVLVDSLDDDEVYAHANETPLVISDAALILLRNLLASGFVGNGVDEKKLWREWWYIVGERYLEAGRRE